jgi:DNA-binding NarL/FixJ family response regulator
MVYLDGEPAKEIRVLVAAHETDLVFSLRHDLAELGFSHCTAARDASEVVAVALVDEPDLCLLAAELPGSAVVATAQITGALPRTPVVILAGEPDGDDCLTYLLAGASGYLPRDVGREALAVSLRLAAAGEGVLPAAVQRRLVDELRVDLR